MWADLNSKSRLEICVNIGLGYIELKGLLDINSSEVIETCAEYIRSIRDSWIIISDNLDILPEGVGIWVEAVGAFGECSLAYRSSQLAMVLQYDDRYQHSATLFLDDEHDHTAYEQV